MATGEILIVGGEEVRALLAGRETAVLDVVRRAYVAHGDGRSSLPHSTFLRFPDSSANRIIALPGFLGDGFDVAGVKWISSFPGNLQRGLARASAVLILNSCSTGLPEAILEGSLISAARTAASAAAAAAVVLAGEAPERVGLIGAGLINREIARFLRAALPATSRFLLYDLDPARARRSAEAVRSGAASLGNTPEIEAEVAPSAAEVLRQCPLVSFATTAIRPHVDDLSICPRGAVILHVSLRDLTARAILACDNVVDDPDHVSRAETSVHLAEQLTASRDFIRCTLADILEGKAPARRDRDSVVVFSPFGLGILDLAVGQLVRDLALAEGLGSTLRSFHPVHGEPGLE